MIAFLKDLITHACAMAGSQPIAAEERLREWLGEAGSRVCPVIYRILQSHWPDSDTIIGPYSLFSIDSLADDDDTASWIEEGFLCIGSSLNGDPLVIRLDTKELYDTPVGLLDHETIDSADSIKSMFQQAARSLDELFLRAADKEYLPSDYYAAKEYNAARSRYYPKEED